MREAESHRLSIRRWPIRQVGLLSRDLALWEEETNDATARYGESSGIRHEARAGIARRED
jgi:hypothetical protein